MRRALMLAVGLGLAGAALPARAQFYDLDGVYRCLKTPDPQCQKDLAQRPQSARPPAPPARPVGPGFGDIIAHVRDKTAGPHDIAELKRLTGQNDPRATEMLAWCELNGIGTEKDPVAAYRLYGKAAELGVPHARENQVTIFERQMTSEQRQQALMSQNRP